MRVIIDSFCPTKELVTGKCETVLSCVHNSLIWTHGGSIIVKCENWMIACEAGSAILIPPHSTYTVCCVSAAVTTKILFTVEDGENFNSLICADKVPGGEHAIGNLLREYNGGDTYKTEKIEALMSVLLIDIYRSNCMETDQLIEQMLTMEETDAVILPQKVGYSYHRYRHIFKEKVGVSPHQYLIVQRIEAAKLLLKRSHATVTQIAYRCGFTSSSYFCQCFKKRVGVTPKEYRRQH